MILTTRYIAIIPVVIPIKAKITAPIELTLIIIIAPTKIAINAKKNEVILITARGNNRWGIRVRIRDIGPPITVRLKIKTTSSASDFILKA
jgi:hypothetical protein